MAGEIAAIEILTCGYRAKCVGFAPCPNLARNIIREMDEGGRPLEQFEFCLRHTRLAVDEAKRNELKIIDSRK
jgi:hypothetical protein